ncbi:tripartite tricarboxylate transporter TctB family protein [Desulfotomaculum defluvii]
MSHKVADILTGIVTLLVAAAFYVQGTELEFESNIFPLVIEVFLLLTGIYMLVRGFLDKSGKSMGDTNIDYRRGMLMVLASVVYVAAISFIGFYVSSFVFLVLMSWFLSDKGLNLKSFGISTVFAVIMIIAVYGTFSMFLDVPTPVGILF